VANLFFSLLNSLFLAIDGDEKISFLLAEFEFVMLKN